MSSNDSQSHEELVSHFSRRTAIGRVANAGLAAALLTGALETTALANTRPSVATDKGPRSARLQATPAAGNAAPTIVLVHGAWADGSSWAGVIPILQQAGMTVVAPANPLRSLSGDAAYIAGVVGQIAGPVLLVGHSYGGAVITNAASQTPNVIGLVYIAGFAPDEGETVLGLSTQATDSLLGPALRPANYPTGAGSKPGTEFFIDPASFHDVFCADVTTAQAAVMAAAQRPAADVAFGEPTKAPAWKTLRSWAVVGTADKAIGVAGLRLMAKRAGATTVEIDASHAVLVSQPQKVADLILTARDALA